MTIVCAIINPMNKKLYFGSDTQTSYGSHRANVGNKWIRLSQNWMIGMSGLHLAGNAIEEYLPLNDLDVVENPISVVRRILEILKEWNIGSKETNEIVTTYGGQSILARLGEDPQLFYLSSAMCARPVPHGEFIAAGSGDDYAYGAAYALMGKNITSNIIPPLDERKLDELCIKTIGIGIDCANNYSIHCSGRYMDVYEPKATNFDMSLDISDLSGRTMQ